MVLTCAEDVAAATAALAKGGTFAAAFTRAERLRLAAAALAALASLDRSLARRLVVKAQEDASEASYAVPAVGAIGGKRAAVLIIGGGGREAALAWKLAQSPRVSKVYVLPGNGGSARAATMTSAPITNVVGVDACDGAAVVAWAQPTATNEGVALVIVGPEAPLVAGVSDALRAAEVPVFGPSKAAAEIEASKAFSKVRQCHPHEVLTSSDLRPHLTSK